MSLRFDNQTVVITGAGGGIGRAYSQLFASRGANIVVNDFNKENADKVVDSIRKAGGKAVANYSSAADGQAVIKSALDAFGNVTILINNAGILRTMTEKEWDQVQEVHVKGAFACSKAAWPHFRKQKFGRIINTASAAGLYGNMGQANYSLVALTKTLALEGAKYNIKASVIAPIAASSMTETIMPPEMLAGIKPEFVTPLVAVLAHPNGPEASGKIFEAGAGFVAEIRWERSKGAVFKTDATFTPSAVKARWAQITDFTDAEHPQSVREKDILVTSRNQRKYFLILNLTHQLRFDGKTVIVTGAGNGLGPGGTAVVAIFSAEDGDGIVKTALQAFGSVHALIANAGILRDKSFTAMSEKDWDDVFAVHLKGTFNCVKAVWPIFQKQKYGRVLTIASNVGIYGNFGQANYSTAKAAIIGFTRTLAIEGERYNILANILAPSAGTAMTETIWTPEMVEGLKPEYAAPVAGYLISHANEVTTGDLFEVSGGWAAQTRWQRAFGFAFSHRKELTPEAVLDKWTSITGFDDRATHPRSAQEALEQMLGNFTAANEEQGSDANPYADPEDPEPIARAKDTSIQTGEYNYSERDVILYNLGIGATEQDLQWTFENHDHFTALPTFGVIPQFSVSFSIPFDFLPNYNPAKLLHGEQYLSIKKAIPTSGSLVTTARLLEVLDKGKAATVTIISETKDKVSGEVIFENQSTLILRGAGRFWWEKDWKGLSGDYNPLHIQPEFAAIGGFDRPILHGLASFGFAGKHIRGCGVPGETLVTSMWKDGDKVIFETKTKERGSIVLAAAAATLVSGAVKSKL
ncbi:hypothetical protein BS47DRAFT_1370952 [Hydnum rufescens UP504]|uniref:Uncharacterized protein n=1 Tax=Hydnum rufescens UP504 TaxID=1448309 RepID=A0A9P6B6T8_9AGAM|nr:hypothetical protein BS47DRAFT_1370952 [Hydnum rufescens UP504]